MEVFLKVCAVVGVEVVIMNFTDIMVDISLLRKRKLRNLKNMLKS